MHLLANGAMGLGLEMFQFNYWLVYVVATVVFEAWWIGRKIGLSWSVSLALSVLANAITALVCPFLLTPALHGAFIGTTIAPNPFGNALALFLGFGLISALIETVIWKPTSKVSDSGGLLWRSLTAHLIGVFMALAILLIPAQPYRGLEYTAARWRLDQLKSWARMAVSAERIPSFQSVPEAIQKLPNRSFREYSTALAYYPTFSRFSFSDDWSRPYIWNTSLNGKPLHETDKDEWVWLIKSPEGTPPNRIEVNLKTADVRITWK
jgi:hypothetical protein